jgi:hypothetical protein
MFKEIIALQNESYTNPDTELQIIIIAGIYNYQ